METTDVGRRREAEDPVPMALNLIIALIAAVNLPLIATVMLASAGAR
jgi:hypothetical protein